MKILAALAVVTAMAAPAAAWTIGSQLDYTGCHEKITTAAFRAARAKYDTAPPIAATADETALFSEVQFVPPADFVHDVAAMTLLLGVRDNDLKGHNPLDSLQLTQVHGDPNTQEEHCIRSASDDGAAGDVAARDRCRAFIHTRVAEALAGLATDGTVDPDQRMALAVYVSFAGHVDPKLPVFYVKLGQAVHALEDGFTHTYRTADGLEVTTVTNWIDYVSNQGARPERDGPPHLAPLDHCESNDPLVARNLDLATTAATALMDIALDPSLTVDAKLAAVDALTTKYLSYHPGCSIDNAYCDAPEPKVPATTAGCSTTGDVGFALPLAALLVVVLRRRRAALASLLVAGTAVAQPGGAPAAPAPPPAAPAPPPPATGSDAPAIPAAPDQPAEQAAVNAGHEPGRDVSTPTVTEVASVREAKKLGNPVGFSAMLGGSFVHGALAGSIGGRYRIDERWTVGLDAEWNPWITTAPWALKAGAASVYGTVIRRFPMSLDRVNLRITLSAGISTVLFDVYGAPRYDVGPYVAFSPLGIDYDLGGHVRLVFDPLGVAVPVPHLGLIPLYYEQFRTMIGIQIGG